MNTFPDHIPFRQLVDYIEGDLPLDRRVELEVHIAACTWCSRELARLEYLITLMRTDTAQDAPIPAIRRAVSLFPPKDKPDPASSGMRSLILAVLHFDSLGLAPAFGVRSGKPGARQLLYNAGLDSIDLRIDPTGQEWTVSGQVLGESSASGVAILEGAAETTQAVLNEMSEFILPSVKAGTYKLILNLADVDVEIDDLRIGP